MAVKRYRLGLILYIYIFAIILIDGFQNYVNFKPHGHGSSSVKVSRDFQNLMYIYAIWTLC